MRDYFCGVLLLSCFGLGPVHAQTTDSQHSPETVFKAKVRVVVVDVVVTNRNGAPITGLQKENFQIFEEGKPQTIASFEEHKGALDQPAMPPLPPNIYTNFPVEEPPDSVNVMLLDALNTSFGDQEKVRLQMGSFLKSIPAGSRIAIFTLSSRLHMVQGFTSDAAVLLATLNKKLESRPQSSPLLQGGPLENLDTDINKQLTATGAGEPAATVASMDTLQQFQNQTQNSQDRLRMTQTLQALRELANYLLGVPGRKNVIWFSDSFPLSTVPGRGVQNYEFSLSEQLELRKTVNLLAAAQIAIYPIAPEGLSERFDSSVSQVKSVAKDRWRTIQGQDIAEVTSPAWDTDQVLRDQGMRDRARDEAQLATMKEIATNTGGEAFYNINDMKEAMDRVISDGAHYYTISYSPTDKQADGRYRSIGVKLSKGDYKLAYRHGYFAEGTGGPATAAVQHTSDPLRPLMIGGTPNATQIVYKIRVLPLTAPQPGSNPPFTSAKNLKEPLTRYGIDFAVLLNDLKFQVTAEGRHQAKIEIAVVAYRQDGTPVNSIVKFADVSLDPGQYATFAKTGMQLHEEIDVPSRGAYLRTGICDLATDRAGTLELPLNHAASSVVAKKSRN